MGASFWPLCLVATAWIAVGILLLVVARLQDSLERWKTKLAALETGVEMHGRLLVKMQDALSARMDTLEQKTTGGIDD